MKQKTTQEQYNLLKEGKIASVDFLKSVKRQFPQLIPGNTRVEDATTILKNHKIINENYIDLQPMGNYESAEKELWETSFKNFLTEEEVKADSTKVSKQVEDILNNNFDSSDKKNPGNYSAQQFSLGCYAEGKLEKNEDKELEEIITIVKKNLEKDPLYYVKNHLHGVEGLGMTEMNEPLEPKGVHKSSGYGDLDKDTKALIKENINSKFDVNLISSMNLGLMDMINEQNENLGDDEESEEEFKIPVKKIENLVKLVNSLIEKAFDEDGDPIPVVDTTGTWESPTVYSPIHFDGTNLTIVSNEVIGNKESVDEYEGENLYHDGIPSLNYIGRMYRKVLKKHNISENFIQDDSELKEYKTPDEPGLMVSVKAEDINSFEIWLKQSAFHAEKLESGVYFFEEAPENFDNLEKFLQIEMAAEDLSVRFEQHGSIDEKFIPHVELHENKNMNLQQKLKEIEKTGITAALEAKMSAIQEEIDSRQEKISSISENEALADFVDKNHIKAIEKEIKELEKHKNKLEGALTKANGGKKVKKVVADVPDETEDTVDESEFAYDDERYWEEKDDDAYGRAFDEMDFEDEETVNMDSEEDEWFDENEYSGGDHDFKNHPINEGYTTSDKIDFLSSVNYPESKHKLEFENIDKLSPKAVNRLFESYFPEMSKKTIIKG